MAATFVQPNFTAQDAATYKAAIDAAIAVLAGIGGGFAAHEQSSPNMTVRVDAGVVSSNFGILAVAAQNTGTITAPSTNPRIDRVVRDALTGAVSVVTGTEAASPAAPAIPVGKVPVCQVALATSTTTITNGLITDERVLSVWVPPGAAVANGYLDVTVASNEITFALKTAAGNTPSETDPVLVAFRSATAGSGAYVTRKVSSAVSVTINDTATLGTTSAVPHRLWAALVDDGGTVRMAVINTQTASGIFPILDDSLISATAEDNASDSAGVWYSSAGITSKAMRVLGYAETTQTTAGTWAAAPSKVQTWQPGMKLPGDIVQKRRATTTATSNSLAAIPSDNTIPQNTEGTELVTVAITPTSAVNRLEIAGQFYGATVNSGAYLIAALFQDSTADALSAAVNTNQATFANSLKVDHEMRAGTTSATTLKLRGGGGGSSQGYLNRDASGSAFFNGTLFSFIEVQERMA